MVELFANSLVDGFLASNFTGQGIVWLQLAGSVLMLACAIGKWRQIRDQNAALRRVGRDVLGGRDAHRGAAPGHHRPADLNNPPTNPPYSDPPFAHVVQT